MISKKEAIEILEKYLFYKNADSYFPSQSIKTRKNQIRENQYCWIIREDRGSIGKGPYFIDKQNGKIYATGSAPLGWETDFINFKEGKIHSLEWREERNYYLEVKVHLEQKFSYQETKLRCRFNKKDNALESFFRSNLAIQNSTFPIIIINSAFDYEEGDLLIKIRSKELSQQIKVASLTFTGGININNYNNILLELKKFLDWNSLSDRNHTWVSIEKQDFNQPIEKWSLKLNKEIN